LTAHNGVSPVSRIENIPASMLGAFVEAGCVVTKKDPDYLYRSADLATLAGDRYKSQRAACNHLLRRHTVRYDPYRDADLDDALGLFRRWRSQQEARGIDAATAHMLYDAEHAHRYALEHHRELGLDGRVVRVDESLAAYTFGYARSRSIFCVLLEIADRGVPGLGAFVFRQFSREIADRGYTHINTMDDSGLSGLAQSKRAYRPVEMVQSYIATKP
jgi:hypothetical protein